MTAAESSELTCPHCAHRWLLAMPKNACMWFGDCPGCGAILRPKRGDCCIFCSYGDRQCPPMQAGKCCAR